MVPSTGLTIVFFLLLIAPGLFFDLLAERRRPGISESGFREASRIVLASFVLSSLGLAVVGFVRVIAPSSMPNLRELISHGNKYVAVHYSVIINALILQSAIAFGVAYLAHSYFSLSHTGPPLRATSTWHRVLREDCPAGSAPYVRVRLDDGAVYFGYVGHYTADLDQEAREIVLCSPLFSRPPGGKQVEVPAEYQRLTLSGKNIVTMSVQYRPRPVDWPPLPSRKQPPVWLRKLLPGQ